MDLKELNLRFGEAEMASDKEFFDKYLSDNMIFRRASGEVHNKDQFLDSLVEDKRKYRSIETEIKRISLAQDGLHAVVKALVFVKIMIDGKDMDGYYTNMRFFQKLDGEWTLTAWYNEECDENNRKFAATDLPPLREGFPKMDREKFKTLS